MAERTLDDEAAVVTAALAYLRTMHEEAAAIVVSLEAERARVSPGRRGAARAPRPTAGHDGSL